MAEPWQKTPCKPYRGKLDADGYGSHGAHRKAWVKANGPIPDGLEIDHLCNNRACQNVEHMELVTHAENYKRVVERRMEREPECPECGTPWSRTKRGTRICRPCVAEKRKEARFFGYE